MLDWDLGKWGVTVGLLLRAIIPAPLAAETVTTVEPSPDIHSALDWLLPPLALPPLVPEFLFPEIPDTPFSETIAGQLRDTARSITVKVISGESWGSGILLDQQGQRYTVVTNAHVLSPGDEVRVQTPDDRVYPATSLEVDRFEGYDLAIVTFESQEIEYPIAAIADTPVREGDAVVAVGFPFSGDLAVDSGFKFTMGRVSLIPERSLVDGYHIGYTNDVEKGMSGGPVLNDRGEVVAINGMHAYPLWGDPYIYRDGSRPCPPLHEIMERSSWAIPIQTFRQINNPEMPETPTESAPGTLVTLQPLPTDLGSPVAIDLTLPLFARQLQQHAARAKRCPMATGGEIVPAEATTTPPPALPGTR